MSKSIEGEVMSVVKRAEVIQEDGKYGNKEVYNMWQEKIENEELIEAGKVGSVFIMMKRSQGIRHKKVVVDVDDMVSWKEGVIDIH